MFNTLFSTELAASKNTLLLLLAANILLFAPVWNRDEGIYSFAAISTVVFWIAIISNFSSYSDQRRGRLYAQLPTTHLEVFLASWLVILLWLAISVSFWFVYGLTFASEFGAANIQQLVTGALGIVLVTALISIAIDLSNFEPRYVQWTYILSLILFVAIANNREWSTNVGVSFDENSFSVFPFGFERFGLLGIVYAAAASALALYANYKVYEKSERFLQ